jgi:hypothetical protein
MRFRSGLPGSVVVQVPSVEAMRVSPSRRTRPPAGVSRPPPGPQAETRYSVSPSGSVSLARSEEGGSGWVGGC